MMANDRQKAIRQMEKLFRKMESSKEMRSLGQKAVSIIKNRTRDQGMGVNSRAGIETKLRDVTEKYAKSREKKRPRHPKSARGNSCNLTLTGKMLNTLKVLKAGKGLLFIGWKDQLQRDKARGHEERGRGFLNLSRSEVDMLVREFNKRLNSLSRLV